MPEIVMLVYFGVGLTVVLAGNYYAIKFGLNGVKVDLGEIRADVKKLLTNDGKQEVKLGIHGQKLTDLEGRVDRQERRVVG